MKVYTKVVIGLSGQVLEEDSYEYDGPVMLVGGSGGGGGSGKVEFPDYMEDIHDHWISHGNTDTVSISMTDAMEAALGNSPFVAATAYDPDSDIAAMITEADDLETLVDALSENTGLDELISEILDDSRIDADIEAFSDLLDAQITSTVLPRFRAGMRDINAVMSSAFVIGAGLIEEGRDNEVAKYTSGLRMRAFSEDALRVVDMKLRFQQSLAALYSDLYRIKIVAKGEEESRNVGLDEADSRWDLEVFAYGGNLLAAPGGGVHVPSSKGPSKTASVLGGAISGAASGAMLGSASANPAGVAIGAVAGGLVGAGAALLQ